MNNCYKIKKLFGAYIYNGVTPEERAKVDEHIKKCEKCADDLRTRQVILESIKPSVIKPDEIPERAQDRVVEGVYKRIASESLKYRARQVRIRKYVLQPSLAMLLIIAVVTVGIIRFQPFDTLSPKPGTILTESDRSISAVKMATPDKEKAEETKKIAKVASQPTAPVERMAQVPKAPAESEATQTVKTEAFLYEAEKPSLDMIKPATTDIMVSNSQQFNSWSRLVDANFINYSLGDYRRALAEYQRIIDDYPNTDAAIEAQKRIRVILGSEYDIPSEKTSAEKATDTEI